MKVLIVDEERLRRNQIVEVLQKNRHTVKCCGGSGEFMSAIDESSVDKILLDAESWKKGKAMFSYFGFAKKLRAIPIVFYNAPEGYTLGGGREPHPKDRIVGEGVKADDIVAVAELDS